MSECHWLERVAVPAFAPWWSIIACTGVADAVIALRDLEAWELRAAVVDWKLRDCDGFEILRLVRQRFTDAYTALVSLELEREVLRRCAKIDAEFLLNDDLADTLQRLSERLLHAQGDLDFELLLAIRELAETGRLTVRERQIVTLAALDVQRHEMLARLGVRPDTLKTQVRSILRKTGQNQLVAIAEDLRRAARHRRAAVQVNIALRRGVSRFD